MPSVTIRAFIIGVTLIVAALGLYYYTSTLNRQPEPDRSSIPTLIGDGFHGIQYRPDGKVARKLSAQHVRYFDRQGLYELRRAHLTHYDYGAGVTGAAGRSTPLKPLKAEPRLWYLDCDEAEIYAGKVAHLRHNVHLYPDFPDSTLRRVATEKADYDIRNETITSEQVVRIFGRNWIDLGSDFTANLRTNQLTYKGKPNVTIYPRYQLAPAPEAGPGARAADEATDAR